MELHQKIILLAICLIIFIFSTFITSKLRKSFTENNNQNKMSLYLIALAFIILILASLTIYLLLFKK